jgi:hypothetical protein
MLTLSYSFSLLTLKFLFLVDLLNTILDTSKVESGNMHLEQAEFNISEIIERLLNMPSLFVSSPFLLGEFLLLLFSPFEVFTWQLQFFFSLCYLLLDRTVLLGTR